MATKEDILEQIVEEYLIHKGYFVQHNIKFLPSKDHPDFLSKHDSNHSDIDVIGFHPTLEGERRVLVVSCKSWQGGFDVANQMKVIDKKLIRGGREAWKRFRELTVPKWSDGFLKAVKKATGTDQFTYVVAVTKLRGQKSAWENHPPFRNAIGGNPIVIITFQEMVSDIQKDLTKTLAATEIGRMLQLFSAAGIVIKSG